MRAATRQIFQTVREFLAAPASGAADVAPEVQAYVGDKLARQLVRLRMNDSPLVANGGDMRLLRLMLRHVLPEGSVKPELNRLEHLEAFGEALVACPHLLKLESSVSAVLRAWRKETRSLVQALAQIPQPHPPVRWESPDGYYRLVEFVHPAQIGTQGILHRNCLVNVSTLMQNRHRLADVLPDAAVWWKQITQGSARVFALTRYGGPLATFVTSHRILVEAEGPFGELLTPAHPQWSVMVEALGSLLAMDALRTSVLRNQKTSHLAEALGPGSAVVDAYST